MCTCQESSQLTILKKNKRFGLFTSQPGNTAHTNIFSVKGLGCWAERKIFKLNNATPFPSSGWGSYFPVISYYTKGNSGTCLCTNQVTLWDNYISCLVKRSKPHCSRAALINVAQLAHQTNLIENINGSNKSYLVSKRHIAIPTEASYSTCSETGPNVRLNIIMLMKQGYKILSSHT